MSVTIQTHDLTVCKNCGHTHQGKFCSDCGQKLAIHRLNAHDIQHEFIHQYLHLDRGFFYTFKQLILAPGHTVREFIDGKRIKYYSPIGYVLIFGTICSYLITKYSAMLFTPELMDSMLHFENPTLQKIYGNPEFKTNMEESMKKGYANYTYLLFIQISFFAFFSSKLYRNGKYNFIECAVLNMYLYAQGQFYSLVCTIPLFFLLKQSFLWMIPTSIIPMALMCYGYVQFFQEKKVFKSIIKFLLTYFLAIILLGIVSGIIGVIAGVVMGYLKHRG